MNAKEPSIQSKSLRYRRRCRKPCVICGALTFDGIIVPVPFRHSLTLGGKCTDVQDWIMTIALCSSHLPEVVQDLIRSIARSQTARDLVATRREKRGKRSLGRKANKGEIRSSPNSGKEATRDNR